MVKFRKMHSCGNDFMIIDLREGGVLPEPIRITALADRHRGVGFDQLIVIEAAPVGISAAAKLTFYNADGKQAQACGNGTNCAAELLLQQHKLDNLQLVIDSRIYDSSRIAASTIKSRMGAPIFNWEQIPLAEPVNDIFALPVHLNGNSQPAAVGMGNPHCVFFSSEHDHLDQIRGAAAKLELHPLFPQRVNISIAEVIAPQRIRLQVWERGVGFTLACGTGACATAVIAIAKGLCQSPVVMELPGGELGVSWPGLAKNESGQPDTAQSGLRDQIINNPELPLAEVNLIGKVEHSYQGELA